MRVHASSIKVGTLRMCRSTLGNSNDGGFAGKFAIKTFWWQQWPCRTYAGKREHSGEERKPEEMTWWRKEFEHAKKMTWWKRDYEHAGRKTRRRRNSEH